MRTHPLALAAVVAPSDLSHPGVPLPKDRTVPNPNQQSALLVSSFNTVTLHPTPYISFNIKTPGSQTYQNIRAFGTFTVSGLDDPNTAQAFVETYEDRKLNKGREKWRTCLGELGKVKRQWGGRWWIRCKYRAKMCTRVGDHIILVGEVLDVGSDVGDEESEQARATGLVYLDGKYRWVGDVATPLEGKLRKLEKLFVRKFES